MSMKANILRDAQGNIMIQMQGDLNYDHSIPFREEVQGIIRKNPNAKITIDLGGLDFVGSSGICHFVETLKIIKEKQNTTVSLSNVKTEFVRVFKLYTLNEADFLADVFDFDSDETTGLNRFANRDNTFEN
jgi:anti-sigma B factor antagonist